MSSNLWFYGSSLVVGLIVSYTYWRHESRSRRMLWGVFAVPVLWTLILVAGKETWNIVDLYDVRNMNYRYPQNRVIFWLVPMFESSLVFGLIWIEKNLILRKRERDLHEDEKWARRRK